MVIIVTRTKFRKTRKIYEKTVFFLQLQDTFFFISIKEIQFSQYLGIKKHLASKNICPISRLFINVYVYE